MQGNGKSKNGEQKLKRKVYEKNCASYRSKLCRLQDWVRYKGLRADHHIRGPRRRWQGRDHQGHHRAGEPARISSGRTSRAF